MMSSESSSSQGLHVSRIGTELLEPTLSSVKNEVLLQISVATIFVLSMVASYRFSYLVVFTASIPVYTNM